MRRRTFLKALALAIAGTVVVEAGCKESECEGDDEPPH